MENKKEYSFLGASDAALGMFIEIISSINARDFNIQIIKNIEVENIHDYLIPGISTKIISDTEWQRTSSEKIIIGVNKAPNKQLVYAYFKKHYGIQFTDFYTLIHSNVSVAKTVKLQNGVILNPGVVIAPFAQLGSLTTVNRNSSIGHHTNIGTFCTIHPGVNIAGHCKISEGVTMGMGANVIDGISIGENSIIGAGSLVTKDIPANVVAYGFPAKVINNLTKK